MITKSVLLIVSSASTSAISTALFRTALKGRFEWKGSIPLLVTDLFAMLKQPLFLLGIADFALANTLWLLVLASQPLATAYPVQIGLVILINTLISVVLFSERVNSYGIAGMLLVVAGIVLISFQSTT